MLSIRPWSFSRFKTVYNYFVLSVFVSIRLWSFAHVLEQFTLYCCFSDLLSVLGLLHVSWLSVCESIRLWSFAHVLRQFTLYCCFSDRLSVLGLLHVSRQFMLSCLSVSLSVFGRLHMCLGSLLCIVAFLTVYPFLVFNITSWVVPADISSKWLYQTFWRQHVFCCFFYLYGRRYIADIPPSPGCLTF